jgi:hypothetical protein
MKTLLIIAASILLVFNGTGAVYGGYHLIVHPDGSSLQMSLAYLQHSPFNDYLLPGIILFSMNGILSFVVLATLHSKYKYSAQLVVVQGAILLGWIIIQVVMLRMTYFLHYAMGSAGVLLLICGYLLWRVQKRKV